MPIKKSNVAKYSSKALVGGGTGGGSNGKKLRSEISDGSAVPTFQNLSDKLIKKKKRLLAKSDTTGTLKRKKSRPQKPLV